MKKENYRKITVADMAPHVHSFQPTENKVDKLFAWLTDWIDLSLECGKIHPYDLLPSKADLACHIGVSQGTIQNVFRLLEDAGYLASKQRIGTFIKDKNKSGKVEKLTSKRELAIEVIKKYISENGYKNGDVLLSTRKLAHYTGISNTTLRTAMVYLIKAGVLKKNKNNFIVLSTDYNVEKVEMKTLAEKVADYLREYIENNFKTGDKLPPSSELTKELKASVKTIHDAIKILVKEGILYTRRGQYGTIVLNNSGDSASNLYNYEKYEQKIRQYIYLNCQSGDKLPSIKNLAETYGTSEKTIKKALDNLSMDGYVAFARGRYGGTFVLDVPQESSEAYKWLAISSEYVTDN